MGWEGERGIDSLGMGGESEDRQEEWSGRGGDRQKE